MYVYIRPQARGGTRVHPVSDTRFVPFPVPAPSLRTILDSAAARIVSKQRYDYYDITTHIQNLIAGQVEALCRMKQQRAKDFTGTTSQSICVSNRRTSRSQPHDRLQPKARPRWCEADRWDTRRRRSRRPSSHEQLCRAETGVWWKRD